MNAKEVIEAIEAAAALRTGRAELRLVPHEFLAGAKVIEVWWKGELVATVTGTDGPGVRVISHCPLGITALQAGQHTVYELRTDRGHS